MFAPATQREERVEARRAVEGELERSLAQFARLCNESEGLAVTGLSIVAAKRDGGFLAIARITVDNPQGDNDLCYGWESGDYVCYSHSDTLLGTLARLEIDLRSGTATLTPDKYSQDTGVSAPTRRQNRRKR